MQIHTRLVCGHPYVAHPAVSPEQTVACHKVLPADEYHRFMQKRMLRVKTPSLVPTRYRVADVDKVCR
jgi:hypothetical protein